MIDLKQTLAIIAGGGIGSFLRYILSVFINHIIPVHFPIGTFLINITACFVLGYFVGFAEQRHAFSPEIRLFITVGLCGGFSTFSAFSLESIRLLQTGHYATFFVYILLSVILGIAATFTGLLLSNNVNSSH